MQDAYDVRVLDKKTMREFDASGLTDVGTITTAAPRTGSQ
jgi:hypothetical protein